jgi:hypothetical protein
MDNLGREIPIYSTRNAQAFSVLTFDSGGDWVRIKAKER